MFRLPQLVEAAAGVAGRAPLTAVLVLLGALVWTGASTAEAQVDEPKRPEGVTDPDRFKPPEGRIYTWKDGDRTLRAYLQEDLIVTRDGAVAAAGSRVARTADGSIVRVAEAARSEDLPVFRSVSGALMTLPGGVLLIFDPAWGEAETDAFFAAHGIAPNRVSPLGELPNGFLVDTAPGLPSLTLANELADRDGVEISTPNWWQEVETK